MILYKLLMILLCITFLIVVAIFILLEIYIVLKILRWFNEKMQRS